MIQQAIKIAVLLLGMVSIGLVATAQDAPLESPTVIYHSSYPDLHMPFTVVEGIVDLDPGAGFPLHHHGGVVLALVLEGEVMLVQDGNETVYRAGESWLETPSDVHTAVNAGDASARILATFILPPGAEATIPEANAELPALAPAIPYQAVFPNVFMPGPFSGQQVVLEFAPDATMPLHVHGGSVIVLVLEGEITLRENGEEQVYGPGESWMETPENLHEAFNEGDTPARVAATFLLPPGAEATTFSGN